jgi:hypothetical protein
MIVSVGLLRRLHHTLPMPTTKVKRRMRMPWEQFHDQWNDTVSTRIAVSLILPHAWI